MNDEQAKMLAMTCYIAFDRTLGTLENYPLHGGIKSLEREIPTIKSFLRKMEALCIGQISDEDYDSFYKEAAEAVNSVVFEANKNPDAY